MSSHADRPALGFLLRQAAGMHRQTIDRTLADLGITAPQFFVMTLLAIEPGLSNADLARRTGQRMPTLSAIIDNLKRRGFVAAEPHATHGRIRRLSLTENGRRCHEACDRRAAVVESALCSALDNSAEADVRAWLGSVIARSPSTVDTSKK